MQFAKTADRLDNSVSHEVQSAHRRAYRRNCCKTLRGVRGVLRIVAHRRAVILLPLLKRNGAGVTSWISTLEHYFRAGAKSCPNIATIRRIKVSPGVADKARRGRPAAAAQHLVGAEPRFRVFLIRIRDKSGIRHQIVSSPFPDVAKHLPTTKGTVA